ncbi:MAG: helix-turn-helix transcriptional regulator [Gammaproteobacteria bacterium]
MAQHKHRQDFVSEVEFDGSDSVADYISRIGERVRGMRAQRGITRKDLAKHSGISERYLAQVETGKANMSISMLWRIAEAMDVGMNELLPGKERTEIDLVPLREFISRLSREEQKEAYQMLLKHHAGPQGKVGGVALLGLRGAGKTTLGRRLADEFGIPFVKLSDVIERLAGMQISEIFSLRGQRTYRRLERQALEEVLSHYDKVVLEVGGSLVSEKETFDLLLSRFYTVWLRAAPEEHMQRVVAQGDLRPMEGKMDEAMDDLKHILAEREPYYQAANYTLDTTGRTTDECLEELKGKSKCYTCEWQWS